MFLCFGFTTLFFSAKLRKQEMPVSAFFLFLPFLPFIADYFRLLQFRYTSCPCQGHIMHARRIIPLHSSPTFTRLQGQRYGKGQKETPYAGGTRRGCIFINYLKISLISF